MADLDLSSVRLPSAFQECEYISVNGVGRIYMPNVKRSNETMVSCCYRLHEAGGQYGFLFGFPRLNNSDFDFYCGTNWLQGAPPANARGAFLYGGGFVYPAVFDRHTIEMDAMNREVRYDGRTVLTPSAMQGGEGEAFTLFGRGNAFTCWADLYQLEIYEREILQHCFVPCYLKTAWSGIPAGTIGIYDLNGSISEVGLGSGTPFYTNTTTGVFTKGPDVVHADAITIGGKSVDKLTDEHGIVWRANT